MAPTKSEVLLENYNKVKGIAKASDTPIKTFLVSALMYVAKKISKDNLFSCPVQDHLVYGSLFIYGPAVMLLCISLLISESFWNLSVSGCCCRRHRGVWWRSRKSVYLALLPSLVWLILVFGDGHYYVCAKLGSIESAKAEANDPVALIAVEIKFSNALSQSQIVAWVLILSLVVMATIVMSVDRCTSKLGSRIIKKEEFDEIEAFYAMELFNERIKPMAEAQAKASVDRLFEEYKDNKPGDFTKLAEDYLMKAYPGQVNTSWHSLRSGDV
jgi:hypothetical protein